MRKWTGWQGDGRRHNCLVHLQVGPEGCFARPRRTSRTQCQPAAQRQGSQRWREVNRLPVVYEAGQLVGILSIDDIVFRPVPEVRIFSDSEIINMERTSDRRPQASRLQYWAANCFQNSRSIRKCLC